MTTRTGRQGESGGPGGPEGTQRPGCHGAGTSRRGFLLLVILGVLAVLLAVCVGFLSFTRGEVNSVSHLRDKSDSTDLCHSALDWAIASLAQDLMSGAAMKADRYVSHARGAHWWYRPYEPGFTAAFSTWPAWGNAPPPCVSALDEAGWVYVPEDYFPEGGVRGRFAVQVFDPNGVPNLNDWLEDCNPTQCQMAHMLMDGYGEQQLERLRAWRDGGSFDRTPEPNYAPLRYHEAWRIASRTVRYMNWPFGTISPSGTHVLGMCSPNWLTTNTVYLGLYGAEMNCLKTILVSDGLPLPGIPAGTPSLTSWPHGNYYPPTANEGFPLGGSVLTWQSDSTAYADPAALPAGYGGVDSNNRFQKHLVGNLPLNLPFTVRAYVDPDTGRSPLNVNTCYNSGEKLPTNMLGGTPVYAMEAVFNVESLRRIVQVGDFYFDHDGNAATAQVHATGNGKPGDPEYILAPAGLPPVRWTPAERQAAWRQHELLRTKLAFQYQETLCRYFTGTYRHEASRKFPPLGPVGMRVGAASADYSAPRFPSGVVAFRAQVKTALQGMAMGFDVVDFDLAGAPNVPAGRLDRRMADAVYDNIVPGPATLSGNYPLAELYTMGLGRDELRPGNDELALAATEKNNANVHGFWNDFWGSESSAKLVDSGYTDLSGTFLHLRPKGLDIARSVGLDGTPVPEGPYDKLPEVPRRQQCFGPDCFSTELTTSSTAFIFVINAQIVEAKSLAEDANRPNVLHSTQWGVCVELAPDLTDDPGDYYQSGKPGYYKTLPAAHLEGMDKNSPIRHEWSSTFYKTTAVKEWPADLRGIKSADAASFYGSPAQTRKRVLIRAIWSLNQGQNR